MNRHKNWDNLSDNTQKSMILIAIGIRDEFIKKFNIKIPDGRKEEDEMQDISTIISLLSLRTINPRIDENDE